MAIHVPNTNNVQLGEIVCAPSSSVPQTNPEDIELDELNPDGTRRTENADPGAEDQIQNIAPTQEGSSEESLIRQEENEPGSGNRNENENENENQNENETSVVDTKCISLKDIGRLFSSCFYCSSKRENRGDPPPRLVNIQGRGVITPTRPEFLDIQDWPLLSFQEEGS